MTALCEILGCYFPYLTLNRLPAKT
ncbi:hypothetical protein [Moraxella bovis]|nr:hypothetical protein [Moraxella bovis]UYZ69646.1 hypothetical protein LP122_05070 [Moraxella bovis]UYZ72021.1 hypothetical protein LP089_05120 [Moraxella bovis]UYZ96314.1 hypothetical protein LP121_07600 [Moraxella bovis]UZA15335.1 hypothetical protein LP102_05065 [Moraxella bovis]UZA39199.1 hypothetical protein LP101_05085 [Moraxella bovis]